MQEENSPKQEAPQVDTDEKKPITSTGGEILDEELDQVSGGTATTLSNLANMRHEMLKAVANNLRA